MQQPAFSPDSAPVLLNVSQRLQACGAAAAAPRVTGGVVGGGARPVDGGSCASASRLLDTAAAAGKMPGLDARPTSSLPVLQLPGGACGGKAPQPSLPGSWHAVSASAAATSPRRPPATGTVPIPIPKPADFAAGSEMSSHSCLSLLPFMRRGLAHSELQQAGSGASKLGSFSSGE